MHFIQRAYQTPHLAAEHSRALIVPPWHEVAMRELELTAVAQHPETALYCIALAQDKMKILNSNWICMTLEKS